MSCILTISGRKFNVDEFIDTTKLVPYRRSYKGQPKFKTKPNGGKLAHSVSLSIEASKADFDNFKKQVADTTLFLKKNKDKLAHVAATRGIDYAVLDFGINLRIDKEKVHMQSDTFPSKLLKLAGELCLDIELSIYPVDMQTILEKRHSKQNK